MLCNTEISLKLHANHLRSPFALHKWFACSVDLLESGFELMSQNILCILYRCSNATAIDCIYIEYSLTFSWELIVEEYRYTGYSTRKCLYLYGRSGLPM